MKVCGEARESLRLIADFLDALQRRVCCGGLESLGLFRTAAEEKRSLTSIMREL